MKEFTHSEEDVVMDENIVLDESDIVALASPKVFTRGRALFDEGALEELTYKPVKGGLRICAVCQGSEDEAYSLHAQLSENDIGETRCSCPYDYDGLCKHLVALLLAWAHTPEAFEKAATEKSHSALFLQLRERERDELAQIIVQLTEAEPKLRAQVKRLLQPRLPESEVSKTQKAVESILKRVMRNSFEGDFAGIARDLKFHLSAAQSLETMRPADALRLYTAILNGMMGGEEPFSWDESDKLIELSADCAQAMHRLCDMSTHIAPETFEIAAQAFIFNINMGGPYFAEGIEELLIAADDEAWRIVEPMLDKALETRREERRMVFGFGCDIDEINECITESSRDYRRGQILELKAQHLKKCGDLKGAQRLLLEQGTPTQQIDAHLENRDFNVANEVAQKHYIHYPGLLYRFADQLNEAGQWPHARAWAEKNGLHNWLAQAAAERGEGDALELNIKWFKASPSRQQWRAVMSLAPETERETLKSDLLRQLEKSKAHLILFEVALEENQISQALEWWGKLTTWERNARHEALAEAAESSHTDEAFLLWDELAHALIERRSRNYYRLAAKALQKAKRVLEKHNLGEQWPAHIAAIRERYPQLHALQEELTRAKL